jgi:hypothetical protein
MVFQEVNMTKFQAKRFTHLCSIPVAAAADAVFPLLCPVREYEWIDGWDCRLVYSRSGLAEEDAVFTTDLFGEGPTVWVTSHHDSKARRVSYIRVTPDVKVLKMDLQVDEVSKETSHWQIRYTLTALGEQGNALIDHLSASNGGELAARANLLGCMLNHFLKTGLMLKKEDWPR